MPDETIASPIEIKPVDSFVGNENQSGHFARFEGSIDSDGDYQPTPADKLKLSFTMTDEEALLELQYGKYGSSEYYQAQQRLTAKVVGAYGKGKENFLQDNDQLGIMTMFKHNLTEKWSVAQDLLKVDPTKSLQNKPSRYHLFHTLSDSSMVYQDAYNLTKAYVDNTLTDRADKERYSNLTPEIRREMLKLFDLPAGTKVPNDGVSGVQEKWMYPAQKTEDPKPKGAKPPEASKTTPPQPPKVPEPIVITAEEIDPTLAVAEKYLATLTDEQRAFLLDENNFTREDLIASAQRLNRLVAGWENSLITSRMRNGTVLFSPGDAKRAILINATVALNERDTFFDDPQRVNTALQKIDHYLTQNGLTFEQYMLLNMLSYSSETPEYIEQDFNFKRHLFERYKQEQVKKVVVVAPVVAVQPSYKLEPIDTDSQDDEIDEEVVSINIPPAIAQDISDIRGKLHIPIFLSGNDGTNPTVDVIGNIDPEEFVGYEDDGVEIPVRLLDSVLRDLNMPPQLVQQILLTRDVMIGEDELDEDLVLEKKIRLALWKRYQELNPI